MKEYFLNERELFDHLKSYKHYKYYSIFVEYFELISNNVV